MTAPPSEAGRLHPLFEEICVAHGLVAQRGSEGHRLRELQDALKPFAQIPLCYPRLGSQRLPANLDVPAPGEAYTAADVLRARKLLP